MKKRLLVAFLVILTLALVSNAYAALDIPWAPDSIASSLGLSFLNYYNVTSTQDEASVSFSCSFKQNSFVLACSPSSATNLVAGVPKTIAYSITVGSNQRAGDYTGNITATTGTTSASASPKVTVPENPDVQITPESKTIIQGEQESIQISFANTGNTDFGTMFFSVSPLISGSNILDLGVAGSPILLDYGFTDIETITFTVPSGQPAGTYTGTVSITGTSYSSPITLTVAQAVKSVSISAPKISDAQFNSTDSTTITVTNNGNVDISGLTLSLTGLDLFSPILSDTSSFNLDVGESRTITVTFDIPLDVNSQTYLGTVTVSNSELSKQQNLELDVEGAFVIKDLEIKVGSKTHKSVDDGDNIDEIKPGDTIRVEIELRNNFDSDSDIDIEDIEPIITIYDIDDGDDLEEEVSDFDLDAGDKETFNVEFEVPLKVEDDTFDMEIFLEGEDTNGVTRKIEWHIDMKVEKETHDVDFTKVQLGSSTLSCNRRTSLYTDFLNLGKKNEDDVVLEVSNSALGLDFRATYEMDKDIDDDTNELSVTVPVDATGVPPGVYPIRTNLFYDGDRLTDLKQVNLVVQECITGTTAPPPTTDIGTTVSTIPPPSTGTTDTTTVDTSTSGTSSIGVTPLVGSGTQNAVISTSGVVASPPPTRITDLSTKKKAISIPYLTLLVLANILVIIGIVALIGYLLKKP